jgi:hypothetical protein
MGIKSTNIINGFTGTIVAKKLDRRYYIFIRDFPQRWLNSVKEREL